MNSQKLAKDLKLLIEQGLEDVPVPYAKGNSIRIGPMVVRTSKHGNLVYDTSTNKKVAHTFSKTAAIAIAKNYKKHSKIIDECMPIDDIIAKHFNDALFFKHGMRNASPERYDILETRLDISLDRAYDARAKLERFIFD